MRSIGLTSVAATIAVALGLPSAAIAQPGLCELGANGIEHIVYIQFDNVHFRRDNPNVPSDLEQMPNLLSFLEQNGAFLANHWTPLISHTSVDILTSLTGVYGDRMGVPIGNSLRYFNPNGASSPAGSFAYWTDPLDSFVANPTDTTPQMIDRQGKTHPAPWVPFTRAGCDVGAWRLRTSSWRISGSTSRQCSAPIHPRQRKRKAIRTRRSPILRVSPSIARKEARFAPRRPANSTYCRKSPKHTAASVPFSAINSSS